jgi:hypothetical protein
MSRTTTLTPDDLAQFNGADEIFRHSIAPRFVFTSGMRHVAQELGAYWLIDVAASWQPHIAKQARPEFQHWQIKRGAGNSAIVTCDDGDGLIMAQQEIEFTDFPWPEFAFYVVEAGDVGEQFYMAMLKSEY